METKNRTTRILLSALAASFIGYAAYGVSKDNTARDAKNFYGAKAKEGYSLTVDADSGSLLVLADSDKGKRCGDKNKYTQIASSESTAPVPDNTNCKEDECCDDVKHPGSCSWKILRNCEFVPEDTCLGTCTWELIDDGSGLCDTFTAKFRCEDDSEGDCVCGDIRQVMNPPPGCIYALPAGQFPTGEDVDCYVTADDECNDCIREEPVSLNGRKFRCEVRP